VRERGGGGGGGERKSKIKSTYVNFSQYLQQQTIKTNTRPGPNVIKLFTAVIYELL
jgi:hypothetical protein